MEKRNKITLIITVVICLMPMLLGAVLYDKLPEQMPVHFSVKSEPDNYASKNFALFGIPVILAVLQVVCFIVSNIKMKNKEKPKITKIMEWFIPILTVILYIIMVEVSLGSFVYVGKSVCLILGVMFIIIGNYTPKISYDVGRVMIHPVPKTEKSFRKVIKILGYSFMALGLIFLLLIIWV